MKNIPISRKKLLLLLLCMFFLMSALFLEIQLFHLSRLQYYYVTSGIVIVIIIALGLVIKLFDTKPAFTITKTEIIDNSNIWIQPIHIPLNAIASLKLKKIFGVAIMTFTLKKGYQLFGNKRGLTRLLLELQRLFNKRALSEGWFISSLSAQASIRNIFNACHEQWLKQGNVK